MPTARSAQANHGETVFYTHALQNTGNAADTYTVTVESTQDWAVLKSPGAVNLDPGAKTAVTVNIPFTATAGASDVATVRVSSWAGPTVKAQAVDTTTTTMTGMRYRIYLPVVMKVRPAGTR